MAKKPQSDNYDALGSIFDFIFKEAEKPPDRRRPIRPTGVAGDSELTEAVFAALEKPGAFMSNTAVDEFNEALDLEIGRVKFDDVGNLKITSNSLIDFLKDPSASVDKAIKTNKAIRKSARAMYLGAMMEDFVVSGWAHKYANIEAKSAIRAGITARETEKEKYQIQRAIGQFAGTHGDDTASQFQNARIPGRFGPQDKNFMADRATELLGRRIFKESGWQSMSTNDKEEFIKSLTEGNEKGDILKGDILGFVRGWYLRNGASASETRSAETRFKTVTDGISGKKFDVFDPKVYKSLEKENLKSKIISLTSAPPGSPQEKEKEIYQKTLYLLERDRTNIIRNIDSIKTQLRGTVTPAQKKELQAQLKDAKGALRAMDGHTLLGQIGKWEGYINSLNSIYGGVLGTNVLPSILKGDFFDENKNKLFNPVAKGEVAGVEIYVPQAPGEEGKLLPLNPIQKYNKMGTTLYYATPRSLIRTFFYNGELFAYGLYNNLTKIKQLSSLPTQIQETLLKGIQTKVGKDLDTFINTQMAALNAGTVSISDLQKLDGILKTSKQLRNLTQFFSTVSRVKDQVQKVLFANEFKKARAKIARFILSNSRMRELFLKSGANKLIGKWIAGGGIHLFIRSLVTAAAGALGIATTPIGSAIITALTWIATDLALKAFATMVNIFKWAAIGAIGIVVIVVGVFTTAVTSFNTQNFLARNEIPGSIGGCYAYEETELDDWEDGGWDENVVIPPPSGEECILGEGSFACTQGYIDVAGWSHQNTQSNMPIDLAYVSYIHAPQFCDTGNCSITRIAKINCSDGKDAGGIVEFDANDGNTTYHFKLLHVQPLAGQGEKLRGGQAVAVVQDGFEKGRCWTGKHLHIETTQNGGAVDPLELLQSFSCSVPDESGCPDAP